MAPDSEEPRFFWSENYGWVETISRASLYSSEKAARTKSGLLAKLIEVVSEEDLERRLVQEELVK